MDEPTCPDHPDSLAAPCAVCGRELCNRCLIGTPRGLVCPACAATIEARRGRRRIAAAIGATAVIGLGVVGLAMAVPSSSSDAPAAGSGSGSGSANAPDDLASALREHLRQDPCNRKVVTDLAETLLQHERYADTLADGYRFLGRCGDYPYLRWKLEYAHRNLRQFVTEAIVDTRIIADGPRDSDYWWWRGQAWASAGLPRLAVADDRQSLANSDGTDAARFAAARIGDAARAAGRPCEAVRAWRFFVHFFGGELGPDLRDDYATLGREGSCADEDGRGAARFKLDGVTGLGTTRATVGGATGTFTIDPFAGTTLLSNGFATRAGVIPIATTAERPVTLTTGTIVAGVPAVVPEIDAGGARATRVDVLVADLPDKVDGVLGLSFFWHFDVGAADGTLGLSAPAGA